MTDGTSTPWPRVVASGALWSAFYNAVWAVAWFAFMRNEWVDAMSSVGRQHPWTKEVWILWVILTVPIGVALMAYAASYRQAPARRAVYAAVVLWLPMALAMAVWAWQESLPMRVIASDSAVNLIGMVVASFVSGSSLRQAV